jgi:hypothetical protein
VLYGQSANQGVSPSRPDTRNEHPEQPVSLLQLRAILVSLQHKKLLAKGNILCRQIRNYMELSKDPSTAVLDEFEHH